MIEKRYQIYTKDGIGWSNWFPYLGEVTKWQLQGKLRNEFREAPDAPKVETFSIRKRKAK